MKVKVVELLLTLTYFDIVKDKRKYLSHPQTELAKRVQERIADNPASKVSIDFCAENLAG